MNSNKLGQSPANRPVYLSVDGKILSKPQRPKKARVKIGGEDREYLKRQSLGRALFPHWMYSFDDGKTWGSTHQEAWHNATRTVLNKS